MVGGLDANTILVSLVPLIPILVTVDLVQIYIMSATINTDRNEGRGDMELGLHGAPFLSVF